jgi:hypothetical protein
MKRMVWTEPAKADVRRLDKPTGAPGTEPNPLSHLDTAIDSDRIESND